MKNLIGKRVRLIPTPKHKYSSSNIRMNSSKEVYEIYKTSDTTKCLYIKSLTGEDCGWVYEYETIPAVSSIEELENEIKEHNLAIVEANAKLKYLNVTCQTEFDEKAYQLHILLAEKLKKSEGITETVNAILDITK